MDLVYCQIIVLKMRGLCFGTLGLQCLVVKRKQKKTFWISQALTIHNKNLLGGSQNIPKQRSFIFCVVVIWELPHTHDILMLFLSICGISKPLDDHLTCTRRTWTRPTSGEGHRTLGSLDCFGGNIRFFVL